VYSRKRVSPWGFRLADLESGDLPGRGALNFAEQLVGVEDSEGGVGFLDGDSPACVANADLDLLPGDADAAAGTDPPFHPQQGVDRRRCRPAGTSVADAGHFDGGERIRQRPQHDAIFSQQMQDTVVDADRDPPSGEVEPDRVLPPCQGEQAGGVDGPLTLDRSAVW
jgi:hypothetical protein